MLNDRQPSWLLNYIKLRKIRLRALGFQKNLLISNFSDRILRQARPIISYFERYGTFLLPKRFKYGCYYKTWLYLRFRLKVYFRDSGSAFEGSKVDFLIQRTTKTSFWTIKRQQSAKCASTSAASQGLPGRFRTKGACFCWLTVFNGWRSHCDVEERNTKQLGGKQ